mmetsp:Transcript_45690/g.107682  ORF Transcript_45690/g.107682 Transcript_45690/m.107682 type:complete len:220 (-) Transcript_45690:74-733(-)
MSISANVSPRRLRACRTSSLASSSLYVFPAGKKGGRTLSHTAFITFSTSSIRSAPETASASAFSSRTTARRSSAKASQNSVDFSMSRRFASISSSSSSSSSNTSPAPSALPRASQVRLPSDGSHISPPTLLHLLLHPRVSHAGCTAVRKPTGTPAPIRCCWLLALDLTPCGRRGTALPGAKARARPMPGAFEAPHTLVTPIKSTAPARRASGAFARQHG